MTISSYKDLRAWQLAFQLGLDIYATSAQFPQEERFGLTAQIRRSAVSVSSNIAEGYGRGTRQDYLRFLRIARGSLYEVETQALFALRLGMFLKEDHEPIEGLIAETGRVLGGLIRSIERTQTETSGPSA